MTIAISSLEPVSKNVEIRVKPSGDSTQQSNIKMDNTNTPTYKPGVSFPQYLKSKNINVFYAKV